MLKETENNAGKETGKEFGKEFGRQAQNEPQFFATCPKGLENLLLQELGSLGASEVRETIAGVYFSGAIDLAYRACMWSRFANKVFLPLVKGPVKTAEDLYDLCSKVDWELHLKSQCTLAVDFNGSNAAIRHSQFGAQKVKDAIVDRMLEEVGIRPNVDLKTPDIRINAHLAKGVVHISLDLSGESLHRRGYRQGQGGAPLKENLAAALLYRAGWRGQANSHRALIDPMCGSGTLLIEGAMIAADVAPGLRRAEAANFGFLRWKQHAKEVWSAIVDEAQERKQAGMAQELPPIYGYDKDNWVLQMAAKNIEAAGFAEHIHIARQEVSRLSLPIELAELLKKEQVEDEQQKESSALMICNPPYGERLGEVEALAEDYYHLGVAAKAAIPGGELAVFTGNASLASQLRLRSKKKYKLFNGTIDSDLFLFDISLKGLNDGAKTGAGESAGRNPPGSKGAASEFRTLQWREKPLSDGAQMVLNRLSKNQKRLQKWLQQTGVSCYRLYDADMPEYAAAVDVYDGRLHIQEYAPPKSIDRQKAERRFNELITACAHVMNVENKNLFFKTRQKQKGLDQYQKQDLVSGRPPHELVVAEGKAKIKVNLAEYLDTGLFLDHRLLRKTIFESARGKHFLNLFCYTASASVHAAIGGAASSVSVDMSNTYLNWAKENFLLNNINLKRHSLVREDCFAWLKNCRQGFDLIMLDPPTFSNSKKMEGVLDVQRDHVALIKRCMELLNPGGTLYFSNNLRNFKLEEDKLSGFKLLDISQQTLDKDFQQNPKIHHCWKITH